MQRLVDACSVVSKQYAKGVSVKVATLQPVVQAIRHVDCSDVGIATPMAGLINPVYIPVLEVPGQCSIAMFVLPPGSKLPLHDHPGMGVVAKFLYGRAHAISFDLRGKSPTGNLTAECAVNDVLPEHSVVALSGTECNVHEFHGVGVDGCAFLDVFVPPYDWDDDRPCNYYNAMQGGRIVQPLDIAAGQKVELVEVPPPRDFVTDFAAYEGTPCHWPK